MSLPRTPVNKGKKEGRSLQTPALLKQPYPLPVQPASDGGNRACSVAPGEV